MKLMDTNSKGRVVFKTSRNAYIALTQQELYQAREEIEKAIEHLERNKPRYYVDKRKY